MQQWICRVPTQTTKLVPVAVKKKERYQEQKHNQSHPKRLWIELWHHDRLLDWPRGQTDSALAHTSTEATPRNEREKGQLVGEVLFILSSECYHTVQAKKGLQTKRDRTRDSNLGRVGRRRSLIELGI